MSLERKMWVPENCPLCRAGVSLTVHLTPETPDERFD